MIINDLDGCYIVFDTKNRNIKLYTLSVNTFLNIEKDGLAYLKHLLEYILCFSGL